MKNLSNEQKKAAREIISTGLKKAAESLSFFMNEPMTIVGTDEDNCIDCEPLDLDRKGEKNIHLLTTKVVGELNGICCLIFSESEADHLRSVALPEEIRSNPDMMAELSDGILLEVDNIISASVITQFSNMLKVKIHGDVPSLKKLDFEDMLAYIKEEINKELYMVSFKTSFHSSSVEFAPEFLWLFERSFVEKIIEFQKSAEA